MKLENLYKVVSRRNQCFVHFGSEKQVELKHCHAVSSFDLNPTRALNTAYLHVLQYFSRGI